MRVLYDSKNTDYKKPFGCLEQNQSCWIRIRIPAECQSKTVTLRLKGEYTGSVEVPMTRWEETDGSFEGYESYAGKFSLKESDLYFYYFHVEMENGIMDLYKENFRDVMIGDENCPKWQLTVYPAGYTTPRCFQGQVMYQIFPDRFFRYGECDTTEKLTPFTLHQDVHDCPEYRPDQNGIIWNNDFFGGNLKGIEKKLPYLKRLNVSVIYLNPIFMAYSNHRYDTANYRRVDPLLGTEEDFRQLCASAHQMGMKIILDGVFSHTGSDSLYFDKLNRYGGGAYHDPNSKYHSWYQFHGDNLKEYTSWWGIDTLPCVEELDDNYLDYIIRREDSVLAHWMKLGADGFRLDVADELPDEFIRLLHKRVKELNPDGLVIGEVWEDASNKVSYSVRRRYFTNLELDATMNYPYKDAIIGFVKGEMDAGAMARSMMTIAENYPKPILDCVMNSLSTHDTMRILTVLGADRFDYSRDEKAGAKIPPHLYRTAMKRARAAAFLQFMLPGTGCIYYGDEVGLEGYEDPFNRRFFPWDNINDDLLLFYKTVTGLKQSHPALQVGDLRIVTAQGRVLIFTRECPEEKATVAINLGDGTYSFSYTPPAEDLSFVQSASFVDDVVCLNPGGFVLISQKKAAPPAKALESGPKQKQLPSSEPPARLSTGRRFGRRFR